MNFFTLFSKTLSTITKGYLLKIILLCGFLSLFIVISLVIALTFGFNQLLELTTDFPSWVRTTLDILIPIILGIGGWFILPSLMVMIGGIFQENIIDKIKINQYPERNVPIISSNLFTDLIHTVKFTGWALFLNILILPFYFLGFGYFLSIFLNSYLLGREFFEGVAIYHHGRKISSELYQKNRIKIYLSGMVITLVGLVPIVNLLMPVIAISWMTHFVYQISLYDKVDI